QRCAEDLQRVEWRELKRRIVTSAGADGTKRVLSSRRAAPMASRSSDAPQAGNIRRGLRIYVFGYVCEDARERSRRAGLSASAFSTPGLCLSGVSIHCRLALGGHGGFGAGIP